MVTYYRFWSNGKDPKLATAFLLIALSITLSVITWRFVEQPARRSGLSNTGILIWAGSAMAAVIVLGSALALSGGLPDRFDSETLRIASYLNYDRPAPGRAYCRTRAKHRSQDTECLSGQRNQPAIALVGDSHANHFLAALMSEFPDADFYSFGASGCRPVLDSVGKSSCVAFMETTLRETVPRMDFAAIVISARWRNGQSELLGETVKYLSEFTDRVIVFGQTMEYRTDLPAFIVAGSLPRRNVDTQKLMKRYSKLKALDLEMRASLSGLPVEYYSTLDAACPDGACKYLTQDDVPYAWDYGHLTNEGAGSILRQFQRQGLLLP